MFPFYEIIPLVTRTLAYVFTDPLFWLVIALVALQYHRMDAVRESFFGIKSRRLWRDTAAATGLGLAGGLLGSILMVLVGLTLSGSGLLYIWPVAILLMLINARFLCFAYAGGVLSLSNLIFGFPAVNIPQVLALVALLHMVESLLILVSGHLGAVPAFFKSSEGRVVGGFTLQKFWPIPIVALAVVGGAVTQQGVNMPDWWPLIKPPGDGDPANLTYALIPVVAGLGYGDLAIARGPREKSRLSALFLGIYSVVLLALAVFSQQTPALAVVAALFSPLGHELVIYIGKRTELSGPPVFRPSSRGLRILDVIPDTPAWRAGIRSGDVLLALGGQSLYSRAGLQFALAEGMTQLEVEYLHGRDLIYRRDILAPPGPGNPFGMLPVPDENEQNYMEMSTAGPLGRWWGKLWEKIKR